MSRQFIPAPLKHAQLGKVGAFLYDGISDGNLRDTTDYWKPWFELRKEEVRASSLTEEAKSKALEDFHWNWESFAQKAIAQRSAAQPEQQIFCIEQRERLQGLMFLDHEGQESRIAPGRPISYVAFLSTAPWNRAWFRWGKLFSAVGTLLIRQAIAESVARNFGGRIGLHSLPGADSFYRDALQMRDFGADPNKENLRYFEFEPSVSDALLRGGH